MGTEKKADFSDVTATVSSTEQSAPKADFSDVTGTVGSTEQRVGEQQYTVQKGDSLSRIAKNLLGDANAWKQIFEANSDVLDDPDKIFPGQVLKIPPPQR
ncbi:peptidoglycan-binding protein LysM [Stenotrophomonas pictorum JCM 9942]|jgi:nucleoid-associated protein YgaU|uniref:Potassium binding protein Kbp n=1 Tax=Stenotrophomonas pictorum JCM 9942 TaxID=1236960 RepID=A0A0R0A7J5_9GAMM|nr:LysM peptidoglycan-binding domain-containing protein [Stenotrophomonas pictorum]KRG40885.1 peptidoglycan-binding protein LysM [Stenotrophomonas pictorum JCM 9942]